MHGFGQLLVAGDDGVSVVDQRCLRRHAARRMDACCPRRAQRHSPLGFARMKRNLLVADQSPFVVMRIVARADQSIPQLEGAEIERCE